MKKLLSIYIPTYNRYEHIKRQIEILIRGVQQLSAEEQNLLEVVVSDNASTEYSQETLQQLMAGQENFVYIRQKNNLGIIKNAYLAVEYCQGEYLWILSDDDFLEAEGIAVLMRLLRSRENYNFVFFCHDIYEKNRKIPSLYTGSTGAVNDVYKDLQKTNDFINNCFQLGLSSALICKYDLFKQVFDTVPDNIGLAHCWGQLVVFYLVKLGHGYIVGDLYLHKNQINPPSYNSRLKYVFANIYLGCMKYLPQFACSSEDIAYIRKCYQDVYGKIFLLEILSPDETLRDLAWQVLQSFYEGNKEAFQEMLQQRMEEGMAVCLSADRFRQTDAYQQELKFCQEAISKINEKINNRKLLIWGCGQCGIAMKDAASAAGIKVTGVLDNGFAAQKYFEGVPVCSKESLAATECFVVIAITSQASLDVEQELQQLGFTADDYYSLRR